MTLEQLASEVRRQSEALERLLERLAVDSAPVAVTKARAARELEVSTKTIDRMIRAGELSVVTIRGMPRVPFAELLRVASKPTVQVKAKASQHNARAEADAVRAWRVP